MPLSASILNALEAAGVATGVRLVNATAARTPVPGSARGVLLQTGGERVLLLVPASALLDPHRVRACFGGQPRLVARAELEPLLAQHGLGAVPAVPGALAARTVLDGALDAEAKLLLDSGDPGTWIELGRAAFAELSRGAQRIGGCTVPIPAAVAPAHEQDLVDVRHALARDTRRRIEARLQDTLSLPPMPGTARRILQLACQGEPDLEALARTVELDPSLAAQVMGWALSPLFSAGKSVNSVRDAIFRVLGSDLVMSLSLAISLGRTLSVPRTTGDELGYWHQAVYCAATMERLARRSTAAISPGTSYLCGLLHNFGHLIHAAAFPTSFAEVRGWQPLNAHVGYPAIERHLLGATRDQFAALLLEEWGLPASLCMAVRLQAEPGSAREHPLATLLCLAGAMLRARYPTDRAPLAPDPELARSVGLTGAQLDEAGAELLERAPQLDAMARQLAA